MNPSVWLLSLIALTTIQCSCCKPAASTKETSDDSRTISSNVIELIAGMNCRAIVLVERNELGKLYVKSGVGDRSRVELIGEDSLADLETIVSTDEKLEGFLIFAWVVDGRTKGESDEKVTYYPIREGRIQLEKSSGVEMESIDLKDAEDWFENEVNGVINGTSPEWR